MLDATIFLGEPLNKNAFYHLLLVRLHTMRIELSSSDSISLYNHLQSKLKRGGLEGRRMGGSSGKAVVNKHFLRFLHHAGNFPRIGKGLKLVANGNKWKCYYVSPYKKERNVVCVDYC